MQIETDGFRFQDNETNKSANHGEECLQEMQQPCAIFRQRRVKNGSKKLLGISRKTWDSRVRGGSLLTFSSKINFS